jgi:hypothetical protein
MTTYRVAVSDQLLAEREHWVPIQNFRFISADGPQAGHPGVTICTFEDDNAPPELEGKLVEPIFTRAEGGIVTIDGRILGP